MAMKFPPIIPPPPLEPRFNPSKLILKLMGGIPLLSQYGGVTVTDVSDLEQWRTLGNKLLLKVGLAREGGPHKELFSVLSIWLRVIATQHSDDAFEVTVLTNQWLNMFGRWPLTVAFFVSCVPAADKPGGDLVPPAMRGEMYEAAMYFKTYLSELAKVWYAVPMLPTFWEDNLRLRFALDKILKARPGLPDTLENSVSDAVQSRAPNTDAHVLPTPTETDTSETIQSISALSIQDEEASAERHESAASGSGGGGGGDGSETPKAETPAPADLVPGGPPAAVAFGASTKGAVSEVQDGGDDGDDGDDGEGETTSAVSETSAPPRFSKTGEKPEES